MTGTFISLEGIDGCGKSTQLALLRDALGSAGHSVVLVREPGGTALGESVRSLLLDSPDGTVGARAEALLYAASRAQLVDQVIEPALAAGAIVLADRFVDSTVAYQGGGRQLGTAAMEQLNALATAGRMPDATILVEVDAAAAAGRRSATGEPADRIERAGDAFFDRTAAAFAELARSEPHRIHVIDGSGTPEQVHARIRRALAPLELLPTHSANLAGTDG